jgi:hypothetical protein
MRESENIIIVPGIAYAPQDQMVYIDVAAFTEWLGVGRTDAIHEAVILAALRTVRKTFDSPVRAYVIRGGK